MPNAPTQSSVASPEGHCDSAFAAVREAFAENFRSRNEVGGAVSVRIHDRCVVDLWGGHQDEARTRPWQRDTLVNAYSVGKALTAMLVLGLVERGQLDLDEPVSKGWPEFAAQGKEATTLRMLLSHQGGHPGVREILPDDTMLDWKAMTNALAAQAPFWTPGEDHGYHVNTFGFLVGEPMLRKLGGTFPEALRQHLTGPANADFHIGLAPSEHHRVAPIIETTRAPITDANAAVAQHLLPVGAEVADDRAEMLARTYFNPAGLSGFGIVNEAKWREASIPSTNGHGTARAVAELYDRFMHLDPKEGGIVGPGLRAEARRIHSDGIDQILGKPSRFGLGFQLSQPTRPVGQTQSGFGHFGYGGTLGFGDPESGVAFGYLMNRPGQRWQTPRTNALVEAVYASL